MSKNPKEFIKVDFTYFNPKFQYFRNGTLTKQWNADKSKTRDMICKIIDQQELPKFDANRMKGLVLAGLEKLNPEGIRIVKKEK